MSEERPYKVPAYIILISPKQRSSSLQPGILLLEDKCLRYLLQLEKMKLEADFSLIIVFAHHCPHCDPCLASRKELSIPYCNMKKLHFVSELFY